MKRGFFIVLAVILFKTGSGQTIKTGVLIVGNGNNAMGSSIQSAVSGAKTVWLVQNKEFEISATEKRYSSGIEYEFLKKIAESEADASEKKAGNNTINQVLKTWTDTLKNLTVIKNADWIKLKRSGNGWNIQLNDGRTIKAMVLVDAGTSRKIKEAIAVQSLNKQWHPLNYKNNLYRTSLAGGQIIGDTSASVLLLNDLLIPGQENLLVLNPNIESIATGQAAGATAAYAAFYKKKLSEASLKAIQGELINYNLSLIPFADIMNTDSNWRSIQMIGLSGLLKADIVNNAAYFRPDQLVSIAEITQPLKACYYKAQIWLDDQKEPDMTIASTLDLIAVVGNKSLKNTQAEVEKKWKNTYKFKTEFDPEQKITRRAFAVLINEYLKPFDINIDKSGRVLM